MVTAFNSDVTTALKTSPASPRLGSTISRVSFITVVTVERRKRRWLRGRTWLSSRRLLLLLLLRPTGERKTELAIWFRKLLTIANESKNPGVFSWLIKGGILFFDE